MKITGIQTYHPAIQFFHSTRRQLLVTVTTDEGLTGVGEAWAGAPYEPVEATIEHVLKPVLLGVDSARIEFIWQQMLRTVYRYGTEGIALCAMSGIDLALWDLMGKRLGVPVFQLLGGAVKNGVRVYASFPALHDETLLRENLSRIRDEGFTAVKLHDLDERLIAIARELLGDDFTIMIDPSGAWSQLEAERTVKRLGSYNIYWIEEPVFPMQDHASMFRLRHRTGLRFAAGENEFTLQGFQRLMQSNAVDFVQPEISKIGGLTISRKLAALTELNGYTVCPHNYAPGPAFFAGLHLAVTQAHWDWHELKWLPSGMGNEYLRGMKLDDGCVHLPNSPGLGSELPSDLT